MCISHQMPTYLDGLTHDTSPKALGSLRLRIKWLITRPAASSLIWIVRQGVEKGAVRTTFAPRELGERVETNLVPPAWRSHIDA